MSGSISHSIEAQNAQVDRTLANGSSAPTRLRDTDDASAIEARASSDYQVTLSEEAQNLLADDAQQEPTDENNTAESSETNDDIDSNNSLTEEEQAEVEDLKARDQEVRTHEQAHASTGGQHAGSPSYSYEQGPDGQRYATDGEVQIDVSEIPGDPQATIDKMRQVYRAALAPAEPSGADRSVASEAQQKMSAAQAELAITKDTNVITSEKNENYNQPISSSFESATNGNQKRESIVSTFTKTKSTLEFTGYNAMINSPSKGEFINELT